MENLRGWKTTAKMITKSQKPAENYSQDYKERDKNKIKIKKYV